MNIRVLIITLMLPMMLQAAQDGKEERLAQAIPDLLADYFSLSSDPNFKELPNLYPIELLPHFQDFYNADGISWQKILNTMQLEHLQSLIKMNEDL